MASGPAWVASGAGALGSAVAAIAVQPALLVPVLVVLSPFVTLPLLISILALVAVYEPDPGRRAAAAQVLDQLLVTLRTDRHQTAGQRHPGRSGDAGR